MQLWPTGHLRMRWRTAVLPDCAGMCSCLQMLACRAMTCTQDSNDSHDIARRCCRHLTDGWKPTIDAVIMRACMFLDVYRLQTSLCWQVQHAARACLVGGSPHLMRPPVARVHNFCAIACRQAYIGTCKVAWVPAGRRRQSPWGAAM